MTKGRSKTLIARRDKALIKRYVYWTETKRWRFDDTIKKLSQEEFYISEGRVMAIIRKFYKEVENKKGVQ